MPDLHPSVVLLIGALVVAVAPRRWGGPLTIASGMLAMLAVLNLDVGTTLQYDFYGYDLTVLRADELTQPFALVFAGIITLAALYGWATMGSLERAAALATAGAGLGVVLAGDLLVLFFFWELKVTTAVLLILARRRPRSSAAGMRYLGVHLVGGVVLLAGVLWHLADTGTLVVEALELTGATTLVLAGVLLSAAAVPLHAWLPDAYPESTVAGTVVLSAFTTKSAVYVLARMFPGVEALVWLGIAMALVGVVYAVLEDDIRRLLGYHIVSQVGFMVAAIGVGTESALSGATAHATAHVLYKGLLLMGVGAVLHATGSSRASQLGGLMRVLPWVLVLYLVGAASISGVPLFSGFPAKELAVASVGDGGHATAQWLLKLASVGTFLSVALKLPALTWFGASRRDSSEVERPVPVTMYAAMGIAAAMNVAIGVAPSLLYDRLPGDVTFQPYTLGKVTEAAMLVVFTTVGFVLLRIRFAPKATSSLDADWVYRELPALVRTRRASAPTRPTAVPDALPSPRPAWRERLSLQPSTRAPAGPVAPGWVLSTAIAAAMVLVLAVSVIA